MCAERAQEHTRTHTALTAGVEGEEVLGKLSDIYYWARHRNGPIIFRDCLAREKEKKDNKGALTTTLRVMMKS